MKVLVALWLAILVVGFVAQTTELFGREHGVLAWSLLGIAAIGFIVVGAGAMWLVVRALDDHGTGDGPPAARDDA